MKLDKEKIEVINKTADQIKQQLEQPCLSKDDINSIHNKLDKVLAELTPPKKFFKRLV